VYAGIDVAVERGERVALVGENGAGKSTLLKILAGALPFERGERILGAHVAVHYYAQHQLDALTLTNTVLDEIIAAAPDLPHTRLRTILGAFLFSGDAVDKKVSVLSGGEKARLALAKMLVRPAALLCLDEPTNHLDLTSREVLEDALAAFPGTIVFISHDRYFINRIATSVLQVAHGTLTRYLGTYDDFLSALLAVQSPGAGAAAGSGDHEPGPRDARRRDAADTRRAVRREGNGSADAAATPTPSAPPGSRATRDRRGTRRVSAEVRELRRRLEAVERRVQEMEVRLAEVTAALADPALYADGERARAAAHERKSAEEQLAWLMREWEEISTELAAHE
jgi:ATP-binding cassette subfamily F protein 3